MVGNYLAVIALAGMVAEMVAIFRWDIAEVSMNDQPMTSEIQKAMFGNRTFERLGQEQSIKVLKACGLIDGAAKGRFETIRKIRKSLSPSVVAGPSFAAWRCGQELPRGGSAGCNDNRPGLQ